MDPRKFIDSEIPKFFQPTGSKTDWFAKPEHYKQWLDKTPVNVTHVSILPNGIILITYKEL